MLVCGGNHPLHSELIRYDESNVGSTSSASVPTKQTGSSNLAELAQTGTDRQHLLRKWLCPSKLPFDTAPGHTVTNIGDNKIILIGGQPGNEGNSNFVLKV